MLNHKLPRETFLEYSDIKKGFVIESLIDLKEGQLVHDSYGSKSNTRFFLNYGFCCENNIANRLPVSFGFNKQDNLIVFK